MGSSCGLAACLMLYLRRPLPALRVGKESALSMSNRYNAKVSDRIRVRLGSCFGSGIDETYFRLVCRAHDAPAVSAH